MLYSNQTRGALQGRAAPSSWEPPTPSHTIRSQRQASAEQIPPGWADDVLAETAPPRAASFRTLRSWSWYVVLASLDGQSHETVKAIRAALRYRLTGYGFGKAEAALLMGAPIPPIGQPAKRSGSQARWRIPPPTLTRRLPNPFKAAWARQAGQAASGVGR